MNEVHEITPLGLYGYTINLYSEQKQVVIPALKG